MDDLISSTTNDSWFHVNFCCLTLRQLNLIIIIQPENPIQKLKISERPKNKIQRNSLKRNMTTVDCLSFGILDANKMNALLWRTDFHEFEMLY